MRFTEAAITHFLSAMPPYDSLPVPARRELTLIERPDLTLAPADLRHFQTLRDAGFLTAPNERGRCFVAEGRQDFVRLLRILEAHPILSKPDFYTFSEYMRQHLSAAEREQLRGGAWGYSERELALYRKISSADWVNGFLEAPDESWEKPFLVSGEPPLLSNPEVWRTTQSLLRWLADRGGRGSLLELAGMRDRGHYGAALHAGMRYGLIFLGLEPDTRELQAGVWPTVPADWAVAKALPPESIVPSATYDPGAFLLDDMTALAISCAAEPIRLRANDTYLFAKNIRELVSTLRPLPKWIEKDFNIDSEMRLKVAVSYSRIFELLENRGDPPPAFLHITEQGRKWLGLSASDRLRVLVDGVLGRKQTAPGFRHFKGAKIGATTAYFNISNATEPPDFHETLLRIFRSLPDGGYFLVARIQEYYRAHGNPLLEVFRAHKDAVFWRGHAYLRIADTATLQKVWADEILNTLQSRLVPLGVVRLGHGKEGLSISITPAGRYYLGDSKEWQWGEDIQAQVVVQPNFDVTFLGDLPAAEAEVARFAERRRQAGALFQITRQSVFAAASAGMNADEVVEILNRSCSRGVPANVEREIRGWFAQCRPVTFQAAMLIRCPDRETALRIIGLAKGSVTAVSDTVLEYKDQGKQRAALIKKLKSSGMLVSVDEPPPVVKHVVQRVYRRRGWGW